MNPGAPTTGATDGVQQVGGQRHVQHLFDEDRREVLDGFAVVSRLDRVQRAEVRRDRRVFELERPLHVDAKIIEAEGRHAS
jgi:hypothetical protein